MRCLAAWPPEALATLVVERVSVTLYWTGFHRTPPRSRFVEYESDYNTRQDHTVQAECRADYIEMVMPPLPEPACR